MVRRLPGISKRLRGSCGQFPAAGFYWLDIELHADDLGDLDVENFPTLIIRRQQWILFYGSMPPSPSHLQRTLKAFVQQSVEESREYAFSSVFFMMLAGK